ncbi:hypothetical protein ACA910_007982 [Epithemia clementina (nom. ined.)]
MTRLETHLVPSHRLTTLTTDSNYYDSTSSSVSGNSDTSDSGNSEIEVMPDENYYRNSSLSSSCAAGVHQSKAAKSYCDNEGPVSLPAGAEMIVKQMVAEKIFLEMVDCIMDDNRSPDHKYLARMIYQYPGICHRTYEMKWENKGRRDLYPLAILCCLKPPLELLKFVYEVFPKALGFKESVKGTMAFHYACTFQASVEVVDWMIGLDQTLLNTPRKDGMYPLHLAVFFKATSHVVDRLIKAWPEGLLLDYSGEWSLLHAAAAGRADLELVQRLYDAYPASITSLDERRRTPLHQACWKKGNPEVVSFLFEKAPQALYMEDDQGETPMFRAVRNQSLEVVRLLLPEDPPLDDMGATLLHFATLDNTVDVVNFLLEEHPDMALMHTQERDRYTPLHSACHFSDDLATVQALVQHNPSMVTTVNGHGKTPLETAREFNSSQEIIDYMESVTPQLEEEEDLAAHQPMKGEV